MIELGYRANKLQHIDRDDVSWPFFRLLVGLPLPGQGITDGTDEMYEVEALQLFYQSKNKSLIETVQAVENGHVPISNELATYKARLAQAPKVSDALKTYLASRP
jgi:hypothetical protein